MKKVLFVATVTPHIEGFHAPFLKEFKNRGWETHVATGDSLELDKSYCDKKHEIAIKRSPYSFDNLRAIRELRKIIEKEKFDIIHCHTPMGGIIARLAAKKAHKNGTRIIYTAHGFHFFKGAPLLNWLIYYPIERTMVRLTDILITINQEDYRRAKKQFKTRVEYVPGIGVDPKKFNIKMSEKRRNMLRKELGLKPDDFVMIYLAEISNRKNQRWLIGALEGLIRDNQSVHLLLAGKDSLGGTIQKRVEEIGLDRQIHFLGYRKDVPELLKISDLYVSSSSQEGLPVNIMEAMFVGLPIVAVDCRGVSDLIENEVSARSIRKSDSKGFLKAVEGFLNSPKKPHRYSIERYKISDVLRQMMKIYEV